MRKSKYTKKTPVKPSFHGYLKSIFLEMDQVMSKIEDKEVQVFIKELIKAKTVVAVGAGRVGMAARGFAMRLGHFGFKTYTLGDSTVPALRKGDLLLVCSGSGETQTIFELSKIAKNNGSKVALITGNRDSRIGKIADVVVELKAPSKTKKVDGFNSIQPMTTLNEQCLSIFFDTVVLLMMHYLGETHDTMWARHSNLE